MQVNCKCCEVPRDQLSDKGDHVHEVGLSRRKSVKAHQALLQVWEVVLLDLVASSLEPSKSNHSR